MTPGEYKDKHNILCLSDDATRTKLARENNPNYKHGNSYTTATCKVCDTQITGRGKSGLCKSCSMKGSKNPFANKVHTAETKKKLVAAHKTRDKRTYKGRNNNPEATRKASKEYWALLSTEERKKKLKPFIEAGHKHCKKNKNTKIEQAAHTILSKYKDLKQNSKIDNTTYYVDFLIPSLNLIIECYGDYWHCTPTKYGPDFYNKSLHMTAQQKWDKDHKRVKVLQDLGYTVIIVWENENIAIKLKELLDEHTEKQ